MAAAGFGSRAKSYGIFGPQNLAQKFGAFTRQPANPGTFQDANHEPTNSFFRNGPKIRIDQCRPFSKGERIWEILTNKHEISINKTRGFHQKLESDRSLLGCAADFGAAGAKRLVSAQFGLHCGSV
jgi:hypothetical protein